MQAVGADRRRRRRRADGGVRDPGRAALGRGPVRRHLDGRRRAVAAGDARRAAAARAARRRGAASIVLGGRLLCYRPYRCADGWVSMGALEPKFWAAFCRGVGREDLIEHQFDAPGSPAHAEVEAICAARTRAEWEAFNAEHDCCVEPVLELDEALADEQVRARGMVAGGAARQPGQALRRRPPTPQRGPPPGPRRAHRRGARARGRATARREIASSCDAVARRGDSELTRSSSRSATGATAPPSARAGRGTRATSTPGRRRRCSPARSSAPSRATDMVLARVDGRDPRRGPDRRAGGRDVGRAAGALGRAARRRAARGRAAGAARPRVARARLAGRHAPRPAPPPLPEAGRAAAADARRDVRLRARGRVALGARRLGGPRAGDGLDAHADPARRGRGADAAPARDGRRRLRQRRLERARLGPLPVHQHRADRALPARAGGRVGAAWTPRRRSPRAAPGSRRSVLSDRSGPVARGAQALLVAPR